MEGGLFISFFLFICFLLLFFFFLVSGVFCLFFLFSERCLLLQSQIKLRGMLQLERMPLIKSLANDRTRNQLVSGCHALGSVFFEILLAGKTTRVSEGGLSRKKAFFEAEIGVAWAGQIVS